MRASRLLSILILLQLRGRQTAEALAAEFEVSLRTIYRWVAEHDLRPEYYEGRVYLFTKAEILEWWDENRPQPGRPQGSGGRR